MRTQIAIIGAGPAGMVLAHLLQARGIDALVLEQRRREDVESRVATGVLEPATVAVLAGLGLDARLAREGLVQDGVHLMADGQMFRIDLKALTGAAVTVYGQADLMRDLFDAAEPRGVQVIFEADQVAPRDVSDQPFVTFSKDGKVHRIDCDFVVGCDGFDGICAAAMPADARRTFERAYPFAWLGVLADAPPAAPELIYAHHQRGFTLASMRAAGRSRYCIQCGPNERVEDWPDEKFWKELRRRLEPDIAVREGKLLRKSIIPLRSFVCEPMRHGRLFLAGDAAHMVPPAGVKGLNLAVSDVVLLTRALESYYGSGSQLGLDTYSMRALARVWKVERFAWWFTLLMHTVPGADGFDRRLQLAELAHLQDSAAAQGAFAENYVGLTRQA